MYRYFLPESIKLKQELHQAYHSSGFDYAKLHRVVMRAVYEPLIVDHWDRRELEAVLLKCMGHDILSKFYYVTPSFVASDEGSELLKVALIEQAEASGAIEQTLPWSQGMTEYLDFVENVLPAGACKAGPLGLDAEYELRFGVPREAIALATLTATKVLLKTLLQSARPSKANVPTLVQAVPLRDSVVLQDVLSDTVSALKSYQTAMRLLEDSTDTALEQQVRFGLSTRLEMMADS